MGKVSVAGRREKYLGRSFGFRFAALLVVYLFLFSEVALTAQIVPDGQTRTKLKVSGSITDVTTETVRGSNAFNSFSRFNVNTGKTANLHVPGAARNLLNLVHDEATRIDGILNSYKNGRIGGNIFFANPHGFVVGAGGVINVGALSVSTPRREFMERFFRTPGEPSEQAALSLIEGTVPIDPDGLISIRGRINAAGDIRLRGGRVISAGTIQSGTDFAGLELQMDDLVNVSGVKEGVAVQVENGAIEIFAAGDIVHTGELANDGDEGRDAGSVRLHAGANLEIAGKGRISARGRGQDSDGGTISAWADRSARLADEAVVDVSGGEVSGDGGFIELSAGDKVTLAGGGFRAGAKNGEAGRILIDPDDIEVVNVDQHTDGAHYELIANDSITVSDDVVISTRNLADVAGDDHLTAASRGDSGNLTLKASHIRLENGARLLAQADNGHQGGEVTLSATHMNAVGADRSASASIEAEQAIVKGRNVKLSAVAETSLIQQVIAQTPDISLEDAQRALDNELDNPSDGLGGEFFAISTDATARTELVGTLVEGSGEVTIEARAGARAGFEKNARAEVIISDYRPDPAGPVIASSRVTGAQVGIASSSDTSLTFSILGRVLELADQSWLPDPESGTVTFIEDQLFDFGEVPLVSLSESHATTLIGGGTTLTGTDTLRVASSGTSAAKPTFSSPLLIAAAWGESAVSASTTVGGTSQLGAGNLLEISAATATEVNVTASVNSTNKPIDATFVRARTLAETTALLAAGAKATGGSVDVLANTRAAVTAVADAKNAGGSGVGMAVAVNETTTSTAATVAGEAEALSGDLKVEANTDIATNKTDASAATLGNPSSISARITNFKAGIQRNLTSGILNATGKLKPETSDRVSSFLFPGIREGKFNASGAVAYADSSNTATATVAEGGIARAAGNLDVLASITDRPTASSNAKSTSTGTAIGGAVNLANFSNRADALIGSNASVDVRKVLTVDARTHTPYPWQIDWTSPEVILTHLQGSLLDLLLTSYSLNSAKGKSGLGMAVGISVFGLENTANALVDEGASVNSQFNHAADSALDLGGQSVAVYAENDVNSISAAGILSKKILGTGGKAAVGGSGNILKVTGRATAAIRDGARVDSHGAVSVAAESRNQLVTVTEAGGSAEQVGIEGAFSMNTIDTTTRAYIDDKAEVEAGGDLSVEATGDLRDLAVGGGVAATKGPVGIGFSVSLNTVANDVSAFIGNGDPLDTAPGTGSVQTDGDLRVRAQSDVEIDAYSVAGAIATNSSSQTNVPADAGESRDGSSSAGGSNGAAKGKFGIAVSGDASVNDIVANTTAFIAAGSRVNRAGDVTFDALTDATIEALAGAVTVSTQQNGNGIAGSYAQNTIGGQTAAYSDGADLTLAGDLGVVARTTGGIRTLSASLQASKGKVGVAGSVSVNEIANRTLAYLVGASVIGVQAATLAALDDSSIKSIAGALSFGGKAGIGLSFAWNKLDSRTEAYLDTTDVNASGDVELAATTDNAIDTVSAAIGASSGNMAAAGAVTINTIANTTGTAIRGQKSAQGIDAGGTVGQTATDSSRIFALAGGVGASKGQAGVGVAFAWNDVENSVNASIESNADVESTLGDIEIEAGSTTAIESISAGGGFANKAGIAGSASVVQAGNSVTAGIDGTSSATAEGNVAVAAHDDVRIFSLGGSVAGAGSAAIAIANSTLITDNTVAATFGQGAQVTARGNLADQDVLTGVKNADGSGATEAVKGVSVVASSHEEIQTLAAGGAGAGRVGVAGSATVTILDEKTSATVDEGARINVGATNIGAQQSVVVRASDTTDLLGIGGSLAVGGNAGIGAGADVGVIDKVTTAAIASSAAAPTEVTARKNVIVDARNSEDITSIAGSVGGGGSAGIAGSASVYSMTNITRASIGRNARVEAEGNLLVAADDATEMDIIAGGLALGGSAGVGAAAGVQVISKTTEAFIDGDAEVIALGLDPEGIAAATGGFGVDYVANADDDNEVDADGLDPQGSDSQAIAQQRHASRTQSTLRGLAVTATNRDDIESITVTGAASGGFAGSLGGDVQGIDINTSALIAEGAKINQTAETGDAAQSVRVAAGNDYYHLGVAGSGSVGGGAAAGAGAAVLVASHSTRAGIGDGATVAAQQDIEVSARAQEEMLAISAGLGVGATGVAGSVSVLTLDNETHAFTGDDSVLDAGGNVRIAAEDSTEIDAIAGALAVGVGTAGVGGAVAVNDISKDTRAVIGSDSTVTALGQDTQAMTVYSGDGVETANTVAARGVAVQSASHEDLFTVTAAGAGGFYAGVSGAVSVTDIHAQTLAAVGDNAKINQTNTGAHADQDVNISARNEVKVEAIGPSLAVGGVGVAGAVDVGTIRNNTSAAIGAGAKVNAARDVDVNALAKKDISSLVVSAAGGIGAVAGGVSVYSVGSGLDDEGRERLADNGGGADGYADDQAQNDSVDILLRDSEDDRVRDISARAQTRRSGLGVSSDLQSTLPGGNSASIGQDARISAGRDIDLDTRDKIALDSKAGALSVGAVGLGAGVGVVSLNGANQAYIDGAAEIAADGDVLVTARLDETADLVGFAGTGGVVAADAAVAVIKDRSETRARVSGGTNVTKAQNFNVDASDERRVSAETTGVSIGSVAAGASVSTASIGGATTAVIDGSVGQDADTVGALMVSADSRASAISKSLAAKGGLGLAASGSVATATVDPTIETSLTGNIAVQNAASVLADGRSASSAEALGINVSLGGAVGASVATAATRPTINAFVGPASQVTANNLSVTAFQNLPAGGVSAAASANGAAGGLLVGANATFAEASNTGHVSGYIGEGSTLDISGATSVNAGSFTRQNANASGLSAGFVALGANIARADTDLQTAAYLRDDVKVSGGTLAITASGDDDNLSTAVAGGGGVVAGLASEASTDSRSETRAFTGTGSETRGIVVDTFTMDADHTARFNSRVDSTSASVVGKSGAEAENTVNAETSALVADNAHVRADNIILSAANRTVKDWLGTPAFPWLPAVPQWNVTSGSGGVIDLPAAGSTSTISNRTLVEIGAGASLLQTGERSAPGIFTLDALNDVLARDKVKLDSGGAIAVARATSRILADVNDATVSVADGAQLSSVGDITMGARALGKITAQAAADTYGLAGAPEGSSVARFKARNSIDIGNAMVVSLNDINLHAGLDTVKRVNEIATTARTDLYNKTAIPISTKPDADALVATDNLISVAAGASLMAVRDANLLTDEGLTSASGVGIGKDIYREALAEVASAISNAFGGEDVSFEVRSGSSVRDNRSGVAIDGTVHVGTQRKQDLEIGTTGIVTKITDGMEITGTTVKSVAADILDRIETLRELQAEYAGDSVAVAAYESEIRFLERKLVEIGYATNEGETGFVDRATVSPLGAAEEAVDGISDRVGEIDSEEIPELEVRNTTLDSKISELDQSNVDLALKKAERAGLDPDADDYQTRRDTLDAQIAAIEGDIVQIETDFGTKPEMQSEIAANEQTIDEKQDLIAQLEDQKADLQSQIDSGSLSDDALGGPTAQYNTIGDVTARLGNIRIAADTLTGSGSLVAPGDAEIRITNNSPNFLILGDLLIPAGDGGQVLFNGVDVASGAQIDAINGFGGAGLAITSAATTGSPQPQILVQSRFDPLDPLYVDQIDPDQTPPLAPDIVLQGDLNNLRGLVKVESAAGSIRLEETASIRASEVEIKTRNGDFVQSYQDGFTHVAGAPLVYIPGDPASGTLDRIDFVGEQPGKGIVANGSVLIAGRYLNINGVVQSGIPEWGVLIPDSPSVAIPGIAGGSTFAQAQVDYAAKSDAEKAETGAEFYDVSGATVTGLTGNQQGGWEQITVRYNARENRLELGGVQVQGGFIELFGQIFNTNRDGGGQLRVLDGYGQIKIDNKSQLDMVVNLLDTGRGVKGVINITDILGIDTAGNALTKTTTFTREPGGSRSSSYSPTDGLRYTLTKGTDTVTEEFYRYSQSGWFDIDATKSKAVQDQYRVTSVEKSNDPLRKGEYLAENGSSADPHHKTTSKTIEVDRDITPGRNWKDCNWWTLCANATHYSEYTVTTGEKTVESESVRGDYPISIDFIGFDAGAVDVSSAGSILFNGSVVNRAGDTRISSSAGSISQTTEHPLIGGKNLSLATATGIGTSGQSLQVDVDGGRLDATSVTGDVRVTEVLGDLRAGTIGGAGVDQVVLETERNLVNADADSSIQGKRVELTSLNGAIGSGAPLNIVTGYSDDVTQWADYGLQAMARGDINLKNAADPLDSAVYSGNLLLVAAESATGDVHIETSGALIDNNPVSRTDERTVDELNALWDSMRLRGERAEEKAAETVAAFENGVTQEYRSYWNTRRRQADSASYDPQYDFILSSDERARFKEAQGWNDQQISNYETEKTAEYHRVHERLYGTGADSVQGTVAVDFDPTFRYVAVADEKAQVTSGSSWSQSQLELAVAPGLLKEITDTVTVIKAPNVSGNNVTLTAGTGLGSTDSPRVIDFSQGLDNISREDKAALAAAERGDTQLIDGTTVEVRQPRPVNVVTGDTGGLTATTAANQAFFGSEGDLRLARVVAPGEIRIKVNGSLLGLPATAGSAHVQGSNLILEAATGSIGLRPDVGAANPGEALILSQGADYSLIARAAGDIYLVEEAGDLNVDTIFSRRDVQLVAPGSILDGFASDELNIRSRSIDLTAGGSIGTSENFLDVGHDTRLADTPDEDPTGRLTAQAGEGIFVRSANHPLIIRSAAAGTEARFIGGLLGMTVDGSIDTVLGIDLSVQGTLALSEDALLDNHGGPIALFGDRITTAEGSRADSGEGFLNLFAGDKGAELNGALGFSSAMALNSAGELVLGATGVISGQDSPVILTAGSMVLEGGTQVNAGTGPLELHTTDGSIIGAGSGSALLTADTLTMRAENGAVGEATAPVVADTSVSVVTLTADTGVDFEETAGDFVADEVTTAAGEVRLVVHAGDAQIGTVSAPDAVRLQIKGGDLELTSVEADELTVLLQQSTPQSLQLAEGQSARVGEARIGRYLEVSADQLLLERIIHTRSDGELALTFTGDTRIGELISLVGVLVEMPLGSIELASVEAEALSLTLSQPGSSVQLGEARIGKSIVGKADQLLLERIIHARSDGELALTLTGDTRIGELISSVDVLVGMLFGSLELDSITAENLSLLLIQPAVAARIGEARLGGDLTARVDHLRIDSLLHDGSDKPLRLDLAGGSKEMAESVHLNLRSELSVLFKRLFAENAQVTADVRRMDFERVRIGTRGEMRTSHHYILIDNGPPRLQNADAQLYSGDQVFFLTILGPERKILTDARALNYRNDFIVNSYDPRNSVVRTVSNDLITTGIARVNADVNSSASFARRHSDHLEREALPPVIGLESLGLGATTGAAGEDENPVE